LGGTLFTLLTGKAPRDWRTGKSVAYQWLERPDVTVSSIRADTRSSLRRTLLRMLELRREKRLATTEQLIELLEPFRKNADLQSLVLDEKPYHAVGLTDNRYVRYLMLGIIVLLLGASIVMAWLKQH